MKNLADLPATLEYMQNFAETVFNPILLGQSNLLISIPNYGTNSLIKYLLTYSEHVDKRIATALKKYKIINLNLRGVEQIVSIWEQLANELQLKVAQNEYKKAVLNEVKKLNEKDCLLIINGIENIFLDKEVQTEIAGVFAHLSIVQVIAIAYGELSQNQLSYISTNYRITNTNYIPARRVEDIEVLLEKEERWFNYKLSHEVKEKIIELAGGYSAFARAMLSLAQKDEEWFINAQISEIAKSPQVIIWQQQVYNSLKDDAMSAIRTLLINPKKEVENDYLLKTELVKPDNILFSPLFQEYINHLLKQSIVISEKDKELFIDNYSLKDLLTNQEYLVLKVLWENKNNLVIREQVAEVMWGSNLENYSDWAIDKIISKIRDKLLDEDKVLIQTIKGKGFMLKQD